MKTDIKKFDLAAPKWWNPLFWIAVILSPVVGIVVGIVAGIIVGTFDGLLMGYERGMEYALKRVKQVLAKML